MCDLAYKSSSNPLGPGGSNIRKIVCFHAVLLMRSAECWRQNSWRDSVWPYLESSETCLLTLSGIFLSQKPPFEWNLCCQLGTHRWTLCRNLPGTCQPSQNSPSCPEPWWQWNARRTWTWNTSAGTLDFWNVQPTNKHIAQEDTATCKALARRFRRVTRLLEYDLTERNACPMPLRFKAAPCPNEIWQWTITSSSSFARIWYAGTNFHWNLASGLQVQKICATNRCIRFG